MKKSNIITLSRILKFYTLIAAALFIFSCEKENAEDILNVTPTVIEIPRSGGKAYFKIETNASSWKNTKSQS